MPELYERYSDPVEETDSSICDRGNNAGAAPLKRCLTEYLKTPLDDFRAGPFFWRKPK